MIKSLFKYIFLLISLTPAHTALGMDKKLAVSLVDELAEDLKTGKLKFSSQVPEKLFLLFNSESAHETIRNRLKSEDFFNPPQPSSANTLSHIFTSTERLENLEILIKKATSLYHQGKLTSYWLMFITFNIADLLSLDELHTHPPSKTGFQFHLGAPTIEESFERFAYLNDHRAEYREELWIFLHPPKHNIRKHPDGGETFDTPPDWPIEFKFGNFSLCSSECRDLKWVLYTDCFYLPAIFKNPYAPELIFNKGMAHRVVLVAIPLVTAEFDGVINASPRKFGGHEEYHGSSVLYSQHFSDSLNLTTDPFQKFLYETWQQLINAPQAYFQLFHEYGYSLKNAFDFSGSLNLNQAVKRVTDKLKSQYDHDLSSAENFVRSILKSNGIENPLFVDSSNFDQHKIEYFLPGDTGSLPRILGGG